MELLSVFILLFTLLAVILFYLSQDYGPRPNEQPKRPSAPPPEPEAAEDEDEDAEADDVDPDLWSPLPRVVTMERVSSPFEAFERKKKSRSK